MATTKEELPVLGIYHVWSHVAAVLAWQRALSSSPSPISKEEAFNQHHCNLLK